jgi:putative membrane protein
MPGLTANIVERAMRLIAATLATGRLQTIANGVANLPERGPAVIVARHYHHLFDGLMLFAAIQRGFHIVVTLDWVTSNRTKLFMFWLNRMARWPMLLRSDALVRPAHLPPALFARRDVVRYQRKALREAVALLVEGKILVIFPEGYPNIDPVYTPKTEPDEFLPFKPGFLSILGAAEARLGKKIPIIPAGLRYQPGKTWIGYLSFGEAIYRDDVSGRAELIQRLETAVKNLSGVVVDLQTSALPDRALKRDHR